MKRIVVQQRSQENLWLSSKGMQSYMSGNDEVLSGVPSFTTQPSSITRTVTDNAGFSAVASGTPTYQWYHNGTALTNGGRISGATSTTLKIAPTLMADAGSYYSITNTDATSSVATLTLLPLTFGNGPGYRQASTAAVVSDGTNYTVGQISDFN